MQHIVSISFTYSFSQNSLSELAMEFATKVKPNVEGLIWKIYLNNPDRRRSAGIYLFHDLESASAYLSGPYIQDFRKSPLVSDISIEMFQTMQEPSVESGGPVFG
jgi:hypothetical protein